MKTHKWISESITWTIFRSFYCFEMDDDFFKCKEHKAFLEGVAEDVEGRTKHIHLLVDFSHIPDF